MKNDIVLESDGNGINTRLGYKDDPEHTFNPIQDITIRIVPNEDNIVTISVLEALEEPIIDPETGFKTFVKEWFLDGKCSIVNANILLDKASLDILERCTKLEDLEDAFSCEDGVCTIDEEKE